MISFNKINRLNRKKKDPYSFVFTGTDSEQENDIQLFEYNEGFVKEKTELKFSEIGRLISKDHYVWLNSFGLNEIEQLVFFCKQQGIDNLVIQDILDLNQRPKFQEFENYSFLTIKSTVPTEGKMEIEQISFIFNKEFLISFQEKKADHFDHIRYRLREKKGLIREKGPDFLLYTLLESILDNYFKTLDSIKRKVETLSFAMLKSDPAPSILEEIENQKASVHFIKMAIQPIREFVNVIERGDARFIDQQNLKYYFEIKDICLTLMDDCGTLFSALESTTNLFFSVQGHRMNQVMKTLTIVATIFIPLTFIAGIYGMNFHNMPELGWKYGYFAVWGAFILILSIMIYYFRRKKWF